MERVAAWGVENAVGFDFKTLLEELAQENLEKYTKTFFQEGIEDWRGLGKQEQLEIALCQALREFLLLVQQVLEDADYSEEKRQQYGESLRPFLHDESVLVELGKPFQDVVLKANLTPPAPLPCEGRGELESPLLAGEGQGEMLAAQYCDADKLKQTWQELNLLALPHEFDWKRITKRYKKKVDAILRESQELRTVLSDEATAEVASDSDSIGYRKAIQQTYGYLKLDTLHTSGYSYRLQLLNIFVAQDVREVKEALPQLLELPKEHLERLIKTGQLEADAINPDIIERYKQSYAQETARSVWELIKDGQTYPYLVILGDPGSGKSSLVQYIALEWAATAIEDESSLPLPLLIELRRYVQSRDEQKCQNFVEFCQPRHGFIYPLHPRQLNERLRTGKVFVMFDGLDEVFEASKREEVITEIIRFTQDYPQVRVLVTSRVIGYQPQRLREAKFRHFMLQDLELEQIQEFLTRWHELAFGTGERMSEKLLLTHLPKGDPPKSPLEFPLPSSSSIPPSPPLKRGESDVAALFANRGKPEEAALLISRGTLTEFSPLLKGGWGGSKRGNQTLSNTSGTSSEEGKKKQERLQQAIEESPAIRQLAGNPLLLTMMAILNRNQELPRNRAELYSQASKVLLQQWDVERALIQKDTITIDFKDKQAMLRRVAYQMQGNDKGLAGNLINAEDLEGILTGYLEKNLDIRDAGANAKSIVNQLRERNFILCFLGADYYAFVHRTFLEYFCAWEFVWRFEKDRSLSLEELKTEVFGKHWWDDSWHEVLSLITGMLNEKFAEELIDYLIELNIEPNDENELYYAYCEVRDGMQMWFHRFSLAANCLSEVRHRSRLVSIDNKLLKELKDFTEYLARYISHDVAYQSGDQQITFGEIHAQAVSVIATTWRSHAETLPWLKNLARSGFSGAVTKLARGWKDDPETLPILQAMAQSSPDPYDESAQVAAIQELAKGWKDDSETLPILKNLALSDSDVRVKAMAVRELVRGWKDDLDTLSILKTLAQSRDAKDWQVQDIAVEELARGWKDDRDTLSFLKTCVHDSNDPIREKVMQELIQGWQASSDVYDFLYELAVDDSFDGFAYDFSYTEDEDAENTGASQFCTLAILNGPETLGIWLLLGMILQNWDAPENTPARQAALEAIIKQYPDHPQTLPLLQDRAENDPDEKLREFAKETLENWSYSSR